ncbi:MAG: Gfo/Idh/MocA family protein [Planctomycetota bacterium]
MNKKTGIQTGRRSRFLRRRQFMAGGATLAAAAATSKMASASKGRPGTYRACVIGHTGRGNYGHGLDRVWLETPGVDLVAVADPNEKGLSSAVKRLGNPKGYTDYRRMLDAVEPDFVSVAPRWLDQHCEMVVAAAERGVKGIYLEKPMCRTLVEADRMVAACEKNHVKLAIAFQTRYSQKLPVVDSLIDSGDLGKLLEFRARGKEDRRGGGEDLWVLGTHMFDLMLYFGGKPEWCFGSVRQGGKPIGPSDVVEGAEGIGPLAGDRVHAMYQFAGGATGYFDSTRDAGGRPTRFGLAIYGSRGVVQMFNTGHLPEMYFLPDPGWSPARSNKEWIPVSSAGVGKAEPLDNNGLHGGNLLAVQDLIASVEQDRQPRTSVHVARVATEMIVSVFESQRLGQPVTLPLQNRENPLGNL